MSHQPWEKWKLDAQFLEDLDRWASQNPETSLDKVLKQLCDAIERGKEFFEVIPDGAFPARGLVKGLAHLIRFGKTFATAKAEVHSFAREVVEWVTNIQEVFAAGQRKWRKGHFTRTVWTSLERIRNIIDEICHWAADRLLDKRWSLATAWQKLHLAGAIADFKERISEARAIFHEAAIIHQNRAFDAILHKIGILTKGQRTLEKMLLRIQKTQTELLNKIIARFDDERRLAAAAEKRRQYVEQMLSVHTVANPTYIAQGKAPCDENTRVGVLASIDRWVWDISPGSQNFFWLSGNPGSGKSAITASLSKHSKSKDILWAQFFVNRNNPETTNPNKYFPTIAHQLVQRSEVVTREIHDLLQADHTLLDEVSPKRAAGLFINAVRVVARLSPNKPIVIVIDGLDETDKTHLRSIALIFVQLFDALPDSPNVKVFISSRTDNDIQTPFAENILSKKYVRTLHLDTDHPSSISDVTNYLRRHIAQIVLDHDLDWNQWPGDQKFSLLAKHASGLFIWAVTAVKFFRQQIEDWGRERLDFLLDDLNSKGMIDINTLYGFILIDTYKNQMQDQHDSQWACETFRRLVGAIVVLYEPLSLHDLSKILDLRQTPSRPAVDVIRFVKRLRTVLVAGTGTVHYKTIPRLHKSFFEYLVSNRVDAQFRVDVHNSHCELAIKCLLQLTSTNSAISSFKMPLVYRYACRFWSQHLKHQISGSGILVSRPLGTLNIRDTWTFLQHSSMKPVAPPISLTVSSSSIVASVLDQSCGWDIKHGLSQGGVSLKVIKATGLEDSHMGQRPIRQLIYNPPVIGGSPPDRQCIHYATSYCGTTGPKTMQIGMWNPESDSKTTFLTLKEKESTLSGSTFPNGYFVEAMFNGGVHIRIIQVNPLPDMICETIHISHQSEAWMISHIALSPLGRFLAIGYVDGICFWNVPRDISAGTYPSFVDQESSRITVIVFSRDEAKALSCSEEEKHITLWTLANGKFHRSLSLKGSSSVTSIVAFSPDGMTALSGHVDGTIHFWDVFTGERSDPSIRATRSSVSGLQYSDDGENILSGSISGQLTLWDAETRSKIASFYMKNDLNNGLSACFLPGGQLCGATPHGMKIFNACGKYTDLKLGLESARAGRLYFTSFFPSGAIRILSQSSDGYTIRLMNVDCQEQEWITLESKGSCHFENFTLSPNGARVAASSKNGAIYLWDAGTGRLIASSRPGTTISAFAFEMNSYFPLTQDDDIFFSPDNELLTVSGGKVLLWKVINGELIVSSSLPNPSPFFQESEYDLDNVTTQHDVQWIPSKRNDSGLWMFTGDHVIRAQQDGTLIIAQFDRTVLKKDR